MDVHKKNRPPAIIINQSSTGNRKWSGINNNQSRLGENGDQKRSRSNQVKEQLAEKFQRSNLRIAINNKMNQIITERNMPDRVKQDFLALDTERTSKYKKFLGEADISPLPNNVNSKSFMSKSQIDSGSFSQIYSISPENKKNLGLAEDQAYVIKIQNLKNQLQTIRNRKLEKNDVNEVEKSFTETLETEFNIQRDCKHPNILPVVARYIDKKDEMLFTILPKAEKLDLSTLSLDDIKGLLRGLDYLEGKALIHKDIHPENIMRYNGKAVLIDLGKASGNANTEFRGLAHYQPEGNIASDKKATHKSDIFSFGKVLENWIKKLRKIESSKRALKVEDLEKVEELKEQLLEIDPKNRLSAKEAIKCLE